MNDKALNEQGLSVLSDEMKDYIDEKIAESGGTTEKEYWVRVVDYDGTVLDFKGIDDTETYTLPTAPSHTGLVFQCWSSNETITNNTITCNKNNIMVGAIYTTASGLNEFDIEINKAIAPDIENTPYTLYLNMDFTEVDWGDGTSYLDYNKHTYTAYGKYTIKCDGTAFEPTNHNIFYDKEHSTQPSVCCTAIRLATVEAITPYAFDGINSLKTITLSESVQDIKESCFRYCANLQAVVIPPITDLDGFLDIGANVFRYCANLKEVVLPKNLYSLGNYCFSENSLLNHIALSDTFGGFGTYCFNFCYSLTEIIIPHLTGSAVIPQACFYYCVNLKKVILPDNLTSFGQQAFTYCVSLEKITLPNSFNGSNAQNIFQYCYNLKSLIIPANATTLGTFLPNCRSLESLTILGSGTLLAQNTLTSASSLKTLIISSPRMTGINGNFGTYFYALKTIKFPPNLTSVSSSSNNSYYSLELLDFRDAVAVPTNDSNAGFNQMPKSAKIVVPDSLYTTWITATNWVDLAGMIYKASEVTL